MIYKKDANFPYPLLTNSSNSYDGCNFILDIGLNENTYDYIIQIDYDIESDFIKKLIEEDKARLVLVVQSKDNKFYNLKLGQNTFDYLIVWSVLFFFIFWNFLIQIYSLDKIWIN